MKTTIFFLLLLFFNFSLGQENCCSENEIDYFEGTLHVYVTSNFFDFPLESYATYVSIENDSKIKMDSIVINQFRPGTRIIEFEKVVEYAPVLAKNSGLSKDPKINFNKDIISLFKKYGVYYIARGIKSFSPQDTIPHYIKTRRKGRVLTQSRNFNKSLVIKFSEKSRTKEFADELRLLKGIEQVQLDEKIMEFFVPNDPDYINESGGIDQQEYMNSGIMDFEGAWDIVKGDQDPFYEITIGIIDSDFDNIYGLSDLDDNINGNGPNFYGGDGTGHGVSVASIACAETNNEHLIAGATHNSLFMPFLETDKVSIRNALQTIKNNHDDEDYENDCFVINMSFGYSIIDNDIKSLCDQLYNDYGVLLVAGVSDISGGSTNIVYPAGHSSVIGVGASTKADDQLMSISNYGDDVEVVATGESILTLMQWDSEDWTTFSGTSAATPFVSSLCALILTTEEGWELDNSQIREKIKNSADLIYDHDKTFYRINAGRALDQVTPIGPCESSITITSNPTQLEENHTYEFEAAVDCYNDWVSGWKWEIRLMHENGIYVLASYSYYSGDGTLGPGDDGSILTSCRWIVQIPELPSGYNWNLWDHNGYIQTVLHCEADGYTDSVRISTDYLSTPKNLSVSGSVGDHPTLSWTANIEPDLDGYNIYQTIGTGSEYFLYQVNASQTSFTDNGVTITSGKFDPIVKYRIDAEDISGDKSAKTGYVSVRSNMISKEVAVTENDGIIKDFNLNGPYPNPFNPSTKIGFSLPEQSNVSLKVFNIQGREIATLASGTKEKGNYTTLFNGSKLGSGIYIYKLTANGLESGKLFNDIKRMILIK